MATPSSVTVAGLRKWLQFLDEQLAWSDKMTTTNAGYPVCQNTAELLKFGLHTELKCSQIQLTSGLKSPSEVFDKLVESYNGDGEKALRVYVFCLLTLGRKHRGLYAVQQLTSSRFGIPCPQQLTQALVTRKFFLFHCLLKIALSIKPATAEALMKHFGKEKYLGKNHRNIEHILNLFKQLWQKRVITETDTTKLTQYLEKCSELECAEYLEDYATGNFSEILQEVKYEDLETRDCIPTSAAETSDDGVAHQKGTRGKYPTREQIREESVSEYRRTASPDADANSVSTQTEQFEDDLSVTSSVDEGTSTSRQTVHIDTLPDNAPRLLQRGTVTASAESLSAGHLSYHRHQRGRKSLYVAAVVFLLMLILLGLGLSLAFLWSPLYNRSSTKVGRVNKTIVLQEVNHYYFQSIQVKKDVQSGDSPQNLQAFLVDQPCNSLKTSEVIRLNVTNATSFDSKQNFTKEYLMPGSKISYKVNATLSDPEPEWMHITVTKGYEKAQGVIVDRKAIQVGGHSKWKSTSFEYKVPPGQWDYYTLNLYVPKENQYRYDATVKMVKIETENIENNVEENCTILESDKIQECSLPVSFRGIHAEGCLIGNVYEAVDTHHRHDSVHIVITQKSFERGLASSAIPIGFVVILTLVAVFVIKSTSCCTLRSDNHRSYIQIGHMAGDR